MHVRMRILLLCSFLLTGVGCNSKSETTQQNTQNGQTTTTQQTVNVSNTAVSEQKSNANNANAATTSGEAKTGACALLTSKEIEAVQGEALANAKSSERDAGGLLTAQCFYQLPTFNKSVSLETIRRAPSNTAPGTIKDFWEEKFSRAEGKGEREKEREKKKEGRGQERGEEEEEGSPPQRVTGIGDEAFWVGSRINVALYVLKKNTIVRISIGGPDDQAIKIKKSKLLAQKVIDKL